MPCHWWSLAPILNSELVSARHLICWLSLFYACLFFNIIKPSLFFFDQLSPLEIFCGNTNCSKLYMWSVTILQISSFTACDGEKDSVHSANVFIFLTPEMLVFLKCSFYWGMTTHPLFFNIICPIWFCIGYFLSSYDLH